MNDLASVLLREKPEQARTYALEALGLAEAYDSTRQQALSKLNIGDTYFYQAQYGVAAKYYQDALLLYQQAGDGAGVARSLYYLAINFEYKKDRKKAMDYYKQTLAKYDSLGRMQDVSDINYNIALLYDAQGDKEKALEYYEKSLSITDSLNLPLESAATMNTIGVLFYDWGNYQKALDYYEKSLAIKRTLDDKPGMAHTLNNLGILHHSWGNLEEALVFYRESMTIEEGLKNEAGMSTAYNNIGIIYADQGKYQEAMDYYSKSLEIEKTRGNKSGIATALNNIGELYSDMGQHAKAIETLEESLSLEKENNDAVGMAIAFSTLSSLHQKKGNLQKSLSYNDSSIKLALELKIPETELDAYKIYAEIYEDLDDPSMALKYQKLYSNLKDSLFKDNMHKEIAQLQANYNLNKKEQEIELLNSKNQVHQLDIENKRIQMKRQRIVIIFSITGFVVILIVSVILFRQIHQKRKAYALLHEQNKEIIKNRNELIVAKEKAEESDRLKSIFLANMSHELRTPLNGILGFTEILRSEVNDPSHREMADVINTSGNRLLETLNSIIDLSIIESNKMELMQQEILLDELIVERVMLYRIAARKKNLYLDVKLPEKGIRFICDAKILRNLLNNLIDNAIKYTRQGGITITGKLDRRQHENILEIRVSDTGIGIPGDQLRHIFDKFRQVSEGHNREYEGAGLGLTICKKYMELLNGTLDVESSLNNGSSFTARLPVRIPEVAMIPNEDLAAMPETRETSHQFGGMKPSVLIVENEETNLKYLEYNLKKTCKVDTATDGPTSIQKVAQKKYDAILMDINLGASMNGMTAAKLIREIPGCENIPIAAVTANAMLGQKEEFLQNGCTHYIAKPFTPAQLHELLMEMLSDKSIA
ncbi:MAG: tetratricopeptide repeat protein [Bacteroidales bacterium]